MRKALPITVIFLLLTLSMTPFATAQQAKANIITNQTTEALYVVSSTKYGAEDDIPDGYRTSGWKTIAAGQQKTFWAYDPHKIYFLILKGPQPIKPQPATGTFAFWINRNAHFDIVTREAINAAITRDQLIYSTQGTSVLTHSDGFMRYNNGSQITVTDAWVDVDDEMGEMDVTEGVTGVQSFGWDPVEVLRAHTGAVNALAWHPMDSQRLASGSSDKVVRVWHFAEISTSVPLIGHTGEVLDVAWNPDGTELDSAGSDGTIRTWDPRTGFIRIRAKKTYPIVAMSWKGSFQFFTTEPEETSLDLSWDTQHAVVGLTDNTIQVFSVEPINYLRTLRGHTGSVNAVAWSPDDTRIVSGSDDRTVAVWDPQTGTLLKTLRGHTGAVNTVAWSPDGTRVVSGSDDGTVRIWDAEVGELLEILREHTGVVNAVAWSPDGTRIASGGADNTIWMWESPEDADMMSDGDAEDASQPVHIPDTTLRAEIEKALGKNPGDTITHADMLTLTTFRTIGPGTEDLTGLEAAENLTELYLQWNAISDISALSGLTKLKLLDLGNNNISDISALSGLTNLTGLSLWGNAISDISVLSGLTNLDWLDLLTNTISDISALSGLTKLEWLRLDKNRISDFSPIAGLIPNLNHYSNANQQVPNAPVDIPDAALRAEIEVGLGKAQGATITATDMQELTVLFAPERGIQDLTGLEFATNLTELDLYNNHITDVSPLTGLTNLTMLNLEYNWIRDVSPLAGLTNLTMLNLARNQIRDVSPLAGLTNLIDLWLDNNQISDFSPIAEVIPDLAFYSADNQRVIGVAPNVPVNIPDANLRTEIAEALGKAQGDTITATDMQKLTALFASEQGIQDLTGLEFATNLTTLESRLNGIGDVSPLAGLTNLTTLDISENQIISVSPLAGLTNLMTLNLSFGGIPDVLPLAGLTNLTTLNLGNNWRIRDVSPLAGLTNLTTLNLAYNEIEDVSPLTRLKNLTWLDISENQIISVSPLAGLTNLTTLNLGNNRRIRDVSPLAGLTNLITLNLAYNEIEDISPLTRLEDLTGLDVSSNFISDISPLAGLTNLRELYLFYNQISDVSSLAGLTNLRELYLSHNQISNFSPIADLIPNLQKYQSGNQNFWPVAVDPEAPVAIPDPVLRTVIENELGKSAGAVITQAEMATLTSFNFDSSEVYIQDLTGLEFAVNLTKLHVKSNKISDVSALAGLKKLMWLDLSSNLILDVSALAGLNNLIWLDLSNNPYTYIIGSEGLDIVPIAQLQNLRHLDLASNRISDVSPLAQLKNLSSLHLSRNEISDISPIAALKGLETLKLSDNAISDVSPLTDLRNLIWLDLSQNAIWDVSPLSELTNLLLLSLSGNAISDISPLARLEYLKTLYISYNVISDFSPIAHLIPNLETYENNNQSSAVAVNPGTPVHIPDPNLRTAIKKELRKPPGTTITQAEMAKLSNLLAANSLIRDLTGLEFAINLRSLDLSSNEILDISALAALKNLTVLYLSNNRIWDVSPLANLESLTDLYISYNWISDFSPIADLIPNLETYENSDQEPLAAPEAPVDIPDPVLRTAIENELGKPPGTTITQAEMATLISVDSEKSAGIDDIADPGIQDLTGLEFAINLQTLELDWILHIPTNTYRENRSISDVSPLANLHNLTALDLSGNQISDVSPLANLENLTELDLGYNDIPDTSALSSVLTSLKNLTWLRLPRLRNDTSALFSALSDLENLKILDLSANQISDVSPLAALKNLSWLKLSYNWISDISALADLENLTDLYLDHNRISDISSLAALKNLSTLYLHHTFILSDVSPLADLENLSWLDLSGNRISDVSPLADLENLRNLALSGNRISDISALAALKNLTRLTLNENHILDFSPIADLIPNLNIYENSNQISLTAAVDPEASVHIPDPVLRTAIENELGKPQGTTITQAEMATLISLSPHVYVIRDLTGIEFAINLRGLYIWDNQISDVSALRALENLEELVLTDGQLSDVSPLAALNNLTTLRLAENQISDVSPLAALNNLTRLNLDNNRISDVSSLTNLRNLTALYLSHNRISDVSSLANLHNLTALNLSHNQILDVSPLAALNNLITLYLSNNQISDVSPLAALNNLTNLSLSENQISDVSPFAALNNLTALYLSKNQISDISVLAALENLTRLHLSHNRISDVSALANLHNLTELYLSKNQISDISALKALENLTSVDVALVPFCLTLDPPGPSGNDLPEGVYGLVVLVPTIWTKADTIYEESLSDGVVLTVKFLNGTEDDQGEVEKYASLWEAHGAVRFEFTTTGTSDIIVDFYSGRNEAVVGSPGRHDAREGKPTMWLTDITQRTILHEFGHALGFAHEHETPAESDLDLNKILEEARSGYVEEGLSEEKILEKLESNYERLNADSSTNFSDFDPESVMLYGNLPLKNGGRTKYNHELSDLDKLYMGLFYPKSDPSISSIRVHGIRDGESIRTGATRPLEVTVHASDGSRISGKAVAFSFFHPEDGGRFASAAFAHTLVHTDQSGGAAKTKVTFTGQNDYVIISVKVAGSDLKKDLKIYVKGKPPVAMTQEFNFREDAKHELWGSKRDWVETIYVKPPIDGARVTITRVDMSAREVDRGRYKWWNPLCLCWKYGPWGTAGVYAGKTEKHNSTVSWDPSLVNIHGWVEDGLYQHASVEVTGTIYYEYVAAAPSAWAEVPQETSLLPNYPNPFNPETWIPYHLAEPADVTLTIYAVNGQVVRRLDLGYQAAGFYRSRARAAYWDGRNAVGERVASGLYFYTLTAGEFAATRKLLIRK